MANRFDRIDAPSWMISKFEKTPEGFLKGRACVTNIGVFPYARADGTIEWELRHPDDVFDYDSVTSLKLKPVTNDHPTEMVTPNNIKEHGVGNLGDNPFNGDNIHLTIDMIIQDQKAIDDVMNGKRELSCGYSADLVDESGTWLGMQYTKRQKNIRYNHVAIVPVGRAGEAARIKMDAMDAIMVTDIEKKEQEDTRMAEPIAVDVKVDASDIQAVIKDSSDKYDALKKEHDSLVTEKTRIEAERDSFKEKCDSLEKKVADFEKARADAIAAERKAMILGAAKKAGIEVKADMADLEVQKAVILKAFPKANLDGKDVIYIDARFDAAIESFENDADADAKVREAGVSETAKIDSGKEVIDSMKAKQAMYDAFKARNKKN